MFKVAFLLRLRRDDLIRELRWRWKVEVEREGGESRWRWTVDA